MIQNKKGAEELPILVWCTFFILLLFIVFTPILLGTNLLNKLNFENTKISTQVIQNRDYEYVESYLGYKHNNIKISELIPFSIHQGNLEILEQASNEFFKSYNKYPFLNTEDFYQIYVNGELIYGKEDLDSEFYEIDFDNPSIYSPDSLGVPVKFKIFKMTTRNINLNELKQFYSKIEDTEKPIQKIPPQNTRKEPVQPLSHRELKE